MEKGRTEALAKERIGKVGLADKVVFMADGRILEEGKPEEIFFVKEILTLTESWAHRKGPLLADQAAGGAASRG